MRNTPTVVLRSNVVDILDSVLGERTLNGAGLRRLSYTVSQHHICINPRVFALRNKGYDKWSIMLSIICSKSNVSDGSYIFTDDHYDPQPPWLDTIQTLLSFTSVSSIPLLRQRQWGKWLGSFFRGTQQCKWFREVLRPVDEHSECQQSAYTRCVLSSFNEQLYDAVSRMQLWICP